MRGIENDERVVMIPACSKLYSILQCMCIKRNVLLSSSLCMLARCFSGCFKKSKSVCMQ